MPTRFSRLRARVSPTRFDAILLEVDGRAIRDAQRPGPVSVPGTEANRELSQLDHHQAI